MAILCREMLVESSAVALIKVVSWPIAHTWRKSVEISRMIEVCRENGCSNRTNWDDPPSNPRIMKKKRETRMMRPGMKYGKSWCAYLRGKSLYDLISSLCGQKLHHIVTGIFISSMRSTTPSWARKNFSLSGRKASARPRRGATQCSSVSDSDEDDPSMLQPHAAAGLASNTSLQKTGRGADER